MIRSLNTASLGIKQFQASLDVLANNLANLNTVGYKASRADFVESLNSVLRAPTPDTASGSGTSGVTVGNGVATAAIRSNFSQGSVNQSGLSTDFSISGTGYFLVRNSSSGEVFATRSGNFRLDSTGYLVTDGGMRVQGVEDFQKDPNKIGDIRFDKGTVPSTAAPTAAAARNTCGLRLFCKLLAMSRPWFELETTCLLIWVLPVLLQPLPPPLSPRLPTT